MSQKALRSKCIIEINKGWIKGSIKRLQLFLTFIRCGKYTAAV